MLKLKKENMAILERKMKKFAVLRIKIKNIDETEKTNKSFCFTINNLEELKWDIMQGNMI